MASDMAQSLRSSRSSFGSSNELIEFDTLSNNYFAISNGDNYDSDGSNFAPPTPNTLPAAMPLQLSGAITLIDKFQVEGFLRAMQKQKQYAGSRGFFSKKTMGTNVREKFTFEDMLCFQNVMNVYPVFLIL